MCGEGTRAVKVRRRVREKEKERSQWTGVRETFKRLLYSDESRLPTHLLHVCECEYGTLISLS